jgi:ABC-type glutathione transport system ATPase component
MTIGAPSTPLVCAHDLSVHYRSNGVPAEVVAVRGVSLSIHSGEIVGLIGESGSGKSTLAAAIAGCAGTGRPGTGVPEICGGTLEVFGRRLRGAGRRTRDAVTLRVGYLAQEGADALIADLTVAENVAEPIYQRDRRFETHLAADAVATIIDAMRLPLSVMDKLPHQLSSGQRQRVALARALILEPALLVADEPSRGVDATVRDGVLDALRDLQREREFSAIIVSSELAVIDRIATRVVVLEEGMVIADGRLHAVLADGGRPYLTGLAAIRKEADARAQQP